MFIKDVWDTMVFNVLKHCQLICHNYVHFFIYWNVSIAFCFNSFILTYI